MAYRSSAVGDVPGAPITSATPSTDLVAEIEAAFNAHDNWDFVEELVTGAEPNAFVRRVWKNRGSGLGANVFGSDFHIALARDTEGTGPVYLYAFEVWNLSTAATDPARAIRPVNATANNLAENANGSWGDETAGYPLDSPSLGLARLETVDTGFDFGVLATNNFVAAYSKYSTSDFAFMAGIFESFMGADPFPLVLIGTNTFESIANADVGASREPNKPANHTVDTYNFIYQLTNWTQTSGNAQTIDPYLGTPHASRAAIRKYGADLAQYGQYRGLLRDCIYLPDGTTATRNGDQVTLGGNRHVKMKLGTFGLPVGLWFDTVAV